MNNNNLTGPFYPKMWLSGISYRLVIYMVFRLPTELQSKSKMVSNLHICVINRGKIPER